MNVLACWSDAAIAGIAARLGKNTAQRRDEVRKVLHEAEAVPMAELERLQDILERLVDLTDSLPCSETDSDERLIERAIKLAQETEEAKR